MNALCELNTADLRGDSLSEGKCNGKGSKHVIDGFMIVTEPCKCELCESTKEERKKAYSEFERKLEEAKRRLGMK